MFLKKILLIEDDLSLGLQLERGLRQEGYATSLARTAQEGLSQARSEAYALIILDWMLPDASGIELLRTLQGEAIQIPVLFLTARDAIEDRVLGLDSGADDYLVKPFSFSELLARLRTLLRRRQQVTAKRLHIDQLTIDLVTRNVLYSGQPVDLTPREFDLLAVLINHRGEIVSREMLVKDVWRQAGRLTSLDNVIDVHIAHLRKKLQIVMRRDIIETVRGVGYRLTSAEK
ncbi:MAG: DNA-binding response regulator [Verrucomicrobia bacterium]|nr:MAG: DNA-binding response regulator [Verrucomicrobiota bacterium]